MRNVAALFETELLIGWFERSGTPIHPNMVRVSEHLSAKPGVGSRREETLRFRPRIQECMDGLV